MSELLNKDNNGGFFIETRVPKDLQIKGLKINKSSDLKGVFQDSICIQGMPGMADIGKMAADQLVVLLDATKILEINFDDFPAGAIVTDSILYSPRAEIFYYNVPQGPDIIILTADAQPMSPRGIHAFSRYISKLIGFLGSRLIISLGAFPVEHPSENSSVYITGTTKEILEKFNHTKGITRLGKGIIIGSNGLVPTFCKNNYNIEGLILLAETNGFEAMKKDSYDVKASMMLLDILSKEFDLNIDEQKFNDKVKIEDLEAKIKNEKESIKKEVNSSKKKPMTLPYFG
ncbi:MAG: hypothetical protein EU549_00940 [Promethearchaeota archaeon]|nr:MAG: hypothetical protein EU549_00940 [Candidatus Lokiarchaeota archaeon]